MIIAFYVFAGLVVGGALVTCFAREILRAAMGLLLVLVGVAGLFLVLHANFLAAVQLGVYVGGTLVVIVLGAALTRKSVPTPPAGASEIVRAVVIAVMVAVPLIIVFWGAPWSGRMGEGGNGEQARRLNMSHHSVTTEEIGVALISPKGFLVPLELMAVLLLSVMIGAAYLARTRRPPEEPDPAAGQHIQTAPTMEHSG
jgi:NADH-quinone oxidoreductase subunit J